MIDLNEYANRCIEFLVGDKKITCPELTYKDMARIQKYEADTESTSQDEVEIVLFLLNRNLEGIVFTKENIDGLPAGAIPRIYMECVMLSRKALSEKN